MASRPLDYQFNIENGHSKISFFFSFLKLKTGEVPHNDNDLFRGFPHTQGCAFAPNGNISVPEQIIND